jgi:hypothetical protein
LKSKKCLTLIIVLKSLIGFAQFDVSIHPLPLIRSDINISLEYRASDEIGIELTPQLEFDGYNRYSAPGSNRIRFNSVGFGARLIGKYYLMPAKGCNKWIIGPYLKFRQTTEKQEGIASGTNFTGTRYAVGFYSGYKFVSRRKIIMEIGMGLGRAFISEEDSINYGAQNFIDIGNVNIDATANLTVGYRFGVKEN